MVLAICTLVVVAAVLAAELAFIARGMTYVKIQAAQGVAESLCETSVRYRRFTANIGGRK